MKWLRVPDWWLPAIVAPVLIARVAAVRVRPAAPGCIRHCGDPYRSEDRGQLSSRAGHPIRIKRRSREISRAPSQQSSSSGASRDRCMRAGIYMVALLVAADTAIGRNPARARGTKEGSGENLEGVSDLRTAMALEYKGLKDGRNLSFQITGNDVSQVVIRFIPIGTSFDRAEKILREAGFGISPRPSLGVVGNRPDRFCVIAESNSLVGSEPFGFNNKVQVVMEPKRPGDYSQVANIHASILMSSL